jgi:putative ABC transport system ATP-binding protein
VSEQPLVRCRELARTYGRGVTAVVAVHEVNCEILTTTRAALVGPSGCGKSTLLHLMAGVETPTTGTVEWPGLPQRPPNSLQVGLVFQTPNLLPDLDVAANVALPLLLAGVNDREAGMQAFETLSEVGVAELAKRLPGELSGGQAQRVAIARALAARPRLILADEPTGRLDHDTGQHVVSVLIKAAESAGAGLVVATHDTAVADRLDQRWGMRDGALTAMAVVRGAS